MITISLDWFRDPGGYRIEKLDSSESFLVGISGNSIRSQPLAENEMLYAEFAGIRTAEDLLEFANKYGPPTGHPRYDFLAVDERKSPAPRRGGNAPTLWEPVIIPERSVHKVSRSPVQQHLKYARLIRRALQAESRGNRASRRNAIREIDEVTSWENALGYIQIGVRDDGLGFEHFFVASSLMNAIWLQLAHRIGSGISLGRCEYCGAWFAKGLGTDKRGDSKFCSPTHKVAFHRKHRGG